MPFVGLGLHVLVALFFAVHAIRTGQQIFWLIVLFSFPLLGSLVYFLAIFLPSSRLERGIVKIGSAAASIATRVLDPDRELREARQAFDLTPTAQNQMRLANALLEDGNSAEAVQQFDLCLKGPFAADAAIRIGAARAKLQNGQAALAVQLLKQVRTDTPDFRPESVALLLANALADAKQDDEARQNYVAAVARFDSIDCRAEYAIWAARIGDLSTAKELRSQLEKSQVHWSKHTKLLHLPMIRRVDAAIAAGVAATIAPPSTAQK